MKHLINRIYFYNEKNHGITIDPSRTIFWVGAGIGGKHPTNLPMGNELTDYYLRLAFGEEDRIRFLKVWNTMIIPTLNSMENGNPVLFPKGRPSYQYPRLEYIVGEMLKQDEEFANLELPPKYHRKSSLELLKVCAEAPPNSYHEWLASFAMKGSTIVTTNFDVCIEKAMGMHPVLSGEKDGCPVVEYGGTTIYHIHGIASEPPMDKSLGVTLRNVTKKLPDKFTDKLEEYFREGYTVVFIGYGGVDFFDVKPYFENIKESFPGQVIYFAFSRKEEAEEEKTKAVEYLLKPFAHQTIVFAEDTDLFLESLGENSHVDKVILYAGNEKMNKKRINDVLSELQPNDPYTYHFMNVFRLAGQINISLRWFYSYWEEQIYSIYSDFENAGLVKTMLDSNVVPNETFLDCIYSNNWGYKELLPLVDKIRKYKTEASVVDPNRIDEQIDIVADNLKKGAEDPESRKLEIDVIHYLCGPLDHEALIAWGKSFFAQHKKWTDYLAKHRARIKKLSGVQYNSNRYRTLYLAIKRHEHLLDIVTSNKTEDNVQTEWQIAAEVPDLYDIRKQIESLMLQEVALLRNWRLPHLRRLIRLNGIRKQLQFIRQDGFLLKEELFPTKRNQFRRGFRTKIKDSFCRIRMFFHPFIVQGLCLLTIAIVFLCIRTLNIRVDTNAGLYAVLSGIIGSALVAFIIEMGNNQQKNQKRLLHLRDYYRSMSDFEISKAQLLKQFEKEGRVKSDAWPGNELFLWQQALDNVNRRQSLKSNCYEIFAVAGTISKTEEAIVNILEYKSDYLYGKEHYYLQQCKVFFNALHQLLRHQMADIAKEQNITIDEVNELCQDAIGPFVCVPGAMPIKRRETVAILLNNLNVALNLLIKRLHREPSYGIWTDWAKHEALKEVHSIWGEQKQKSTNEVFDSLEFALNQGLLGERITGEDAQYVMYKTAEALAEYTGYVPPASRERSNGGKDKMEAIWDILQPILDKAQGVNDGEV